MFISYCLHFLLGIQFLICEYNSTPIPDVSSFKYSTKVFAEALIPQYPRFQKKVFDNRGTPKATRSCVSFAHNSSSNTRQAEKCQDKKQQQHSLESTFERISTRREYMSSSSLVAVTTAFLFEFMALPATALDTPREGSPTNKVGNYLQSVADPNTFSGLAYYRPTSSEGIPPPTKVPLIVFLHGAGKNELDVWNLANPNGEHAGLLPSLLASEAAPRSLDNFVVLAPYSYQKASLYDEPRAKVLNFIDWFTSQGCEGVLKNATIDTSRIYLMGFSDGATLGIELLTTRRFAGGVFAAYGFTGVLPDLALKRLQGIPIWMFHSADDVIFPVKCSDSLVAALRRINAESDGDSGETNKKDVVRYTRFDNDPEGFTGRVRGHSTGITASKNGEVYDWLSSLG